MNEDSDKRRFLRGKRAVYLRDETEGLLGQLDELREMESNLDSVVEYIHGNTLKRVERTCETLTRVEAIISLLRRINPPCNHDAITMLISTANHIQAELRTIPRSLDTLLKTLSPESDTPEKE